MRPIFFLISLFILAGCATEGRHLYFGGKCISCWNNPLTGEALDYQSLGATNYKILNWEEMTLQILSESNSSNLSIYGEDYLKHQIGNKYVSLRQNEISYKRAIKQASSELSDRVSKHRLLPSYQITVPTKLQTYDELRQEFPLELSSHFKLDGVSYLTRLPKTLIVNISNMDQLPNLSMAVNRAENFLFNRNNSRHIYVRYIFEIEDVLDQQSLMARVKELQFIDVKPSIVTRKDKEKHAPFKVIKI